MTTPKVVPHNHVIVAAKYWRFPFVVAICGIVIVLSDVASRLSAVSEGDESVNYSYLANSPLVENISYLHSEAEQMRTIKRYDALNRPLSIENRTAVFRALAS